MSRILILYGTTHGQTAKIARYLAYLLRNVPFQVEVADAANWPPKPDGYDAVIVAASVHAQGYQQAVRRWVRRHVKVLNRKPTALISVCLGVLQPDAAVQREVAAIPMRFAERYGWHPLTFKVVAGALPYTRYNMLTRWIMRRIVARAGGDTDTTRDYEYTDWADLKMFTTAFAELVARAHEEATVHDSHTAVRKELPCSALPHLT
jgi:menaquinone-dependent protoporphyrinogen oxidase